MERDFTAGDPDTWTFSCWFKGGPWTSGYPKILQGVDPAVAGDNADTSLQIDTSDKLTFVNWNSGYDGQRTTTQSFVDTGAWYHFVCVYDSGNGTPADRIKMYLNGVQITAFTTETNPSLNEDSNFNKASPQCTMHLGSHFGRDDTGRWHGYMAEVCFIDGTVYTASDFGEFNADSPTIWQPIDPSGLTFGTNGLYLDFKDSANLGNDVSGNNNDLTEANFTAADQGTDSPTNNFCTLNSTEYMGNSNPTFSEGNCQYVQGGTSKYFPSSGTVGMTSGKWYWEVQTTDGAKNGALHGIAGDAGIQTNMIGSDNSVIGYSAQQWAISAIGSGYKNNNAYTTYGVGFYGNVIIGVYLDLDNNKLYFASGGTIMQSGTGIDITAAASTKAGYYVPSSSYHGGSDTFQYNFGGCSAFDVTSAQQDANGYGNFEYSPNDGGSASFDGSAKDFLAVCTKNLGSDGG